MEDGVDVIEDAVQGRQEEKDLNQDQDAERLDAAMNSCE
jgi:hypothetical protein